MRTIREAYIALLTELNKQEAPTLLLEDFNYMYNKSIQNYVNKKRNFYPLGQQVRDDLASLKVMGYVINSTNIEEQSNTYPRYFKAALPENYLHLDRQNIEISLVNTLDECGKPIKYNKHPITTTIDSNTQADLNNNYYNRPSHKRTFVVLNQEANKYFLNVLVGEDTNVIVDKVYIDYLKKPQIITLTQEDLYSDEDNSMELEFTEYVNLEILKEMLILVLENASDPRLNTVAQINQSIAPPVTFQQNS